MRNKKWMDRKCRGWNKWVKSKKRKVTFPLILSILFCPMKQTRFLPVFLLPSIFPSPEQNQGLSHYQGSLNTGGSLPDLSNLHFPSPLSTPLDPEDNGGYPNLSGGSSTGNLPAAMMHLGIGTSQGGWSSFLLKETHTWLWIHLRRTCLTNSYEIINVNDFSIYLSESFKLGDFFKFKI